MSENVGMGYGYSEAEASVSSVVFGLNTGVKMTKFKWTANGGKDGAPLEVLEMEFEKDGKKLYGNRFPVKKAYAKAEDGSQIEVEDPAHPAFKKAIVDLSSVIIHVVGAYVEKEDIKAALSRNIPDFKTYCGILESILPKNFNEIEVDMFLQYQWSIKGENKVTFLELPKNMKHGRWIAKSQDVAWEKQAKPNAASNDTALRYVNPENGDVHSFTRNGWYMASNFAHQQKEEQEDAGAEMNQGTGGSEASW